MDKKQHDALSTDIKTKDGKILHYIRSNSTVLEFGPGYGRMTKFMKEALNCKVYIVEIDKDAYENAIKYAERGICADILEFSWLKEFGGINFDHIIFSNVLEDLLAPWDVLEKSLTFLKDDGSVLLSVPNIAHSAVLINLLNNKFEYTDVGLLDKKHIRFFTHSSLVEMLENCSLVPVVEDGTVCIPENTEYKNSFNDISGKTEILEQKEFANTYQFVFKCIKKKYYLANKNNCKIQKLYGNTISPFFCKIYFDTGSNFNSYEVISIPFYIQNDHFEVIVNTNSDCKSIRFDPFEGYACIINNLQIITDNGLISYTYTNGKEIDGIFIFDNLDPQIIVDFKGISNSKIKISGDIYKYSFDSISLISKGKRIFEKYFEIKSDLNTLQSEKDRLVVERDNLINERDMLANERSRLTAERDGLINSLSWRITRPLRLLKKILLYIFKRKQIREPIPFFEKNTFLTQHEMLSQKNTVFHKKIKISIITPLYNTPEQFLKEMIQSVKNQTYSNWELCLADGSDNKHKNVKHICKNFIRYDKRIKYKKLNKNLGISENSNKAIEMSCGEYIGLLDHDDVLHPSALFEVMKAICYDNADFIYTDETTFINRLDNIVWKHHKPDFAIDTLRSCNYICHFSVFSRKLMEQAGNFRSEFDGSQDYDLILRYTDMASKIYHIPKVLYFWRNNENSVLSDINNKEYAVLAAKKAIEENLNKHGITAQIESTKKYSSFYRIKYNLIEKPLVSIIISNKSSVSLLQNCLSSIIEKTTFDNYEIIIIENKSTEEATFKYYENLKRRTNIHIVILEEKEVNDSKLINFGVQHAKGKHLLFLNNNVEIITPNWIEEMLMYSQRSDVGAVGMKLYFSDNTIQHAGIILGIGEIAGYIFQNVPRDTVGYMARTHIVQNMSAVTADCMMVRRSVFEEVGCFSPEFYDSLNDIDLCLKIRQAGYLIVWTPYAEAYNKKAKQNDYSKESEDEYAKNISLFKTKWEKELAAGDPYYNCNFCLDKTDYIINDK